MPNLFDLLIIALFGGTVLLSFMGGLGKVFSTLAGLYGGALVAALFYQTFAEVVLTKLFPKMQDFTGDLVAFLFLMLWSSRSKRRSFVPTRAARRNSGRPLSPAWSGMLGRIPFGPQGSPRCSASRTSPLHCSKAVISAAARGRPRLTCGLRPIPCSAPPLRPCVAMGASTGSWRGRAWRPSGARRIPSRTSAVLPRPSPAGLT